MSDQGNSPWRHDVMYGPTSSLRPKLTGKDRDDIKRRLGEGESAQALALEYKVTASTIRTLR